MEFGANTLQLNELRLAERSPAGAAIEDDQRGPARPVGMKVDELAIDSAKHEAGEQLTFSRSQVFEINCHSASPPYPTRP